MSFSLILVGLVFLLPACSLKAVPTEKSAEAIASVTIPSPREITKDLGIEKGKEEKETIQGKAPTSKTMKWEEGTMEIVQIENDFPEPAYDWLALTPRFTMQQVEWRVEREKLSLLFVEEEHLAISKGKSGKIFRGWLKRVMYEGRWEENPVTHVKKFTPVRQSRCGNDAGGFYILIKPGRLIKTVVYRDKEKVSRVDTKTVQKTVEIQSPALPPSPPCPSVTYSPKERMGLVEIPGSGTGPGDGGAACGAGGPAGR